MASHTINGLSVKPILGDFGAEVSGVDWTQVPLPEDLIRTLIRIQDKYAVLIFRDTGLDNERHVAFSAQLGRLEVNPAWGGSERVGTPYLFDVSNIESDGSLVKKDTRRWHHALGNALWHTDSSFNQHRSKYSLLLAHAVPGTGQGNTEFADTRRAWKDIPAVEKPKLRGLVVEHELWHSRKLASPEEYEELTSEERNVKPPSYHRLVQQGSSGHETFFLAAHAKALFDDDGKRLADSQKMVWDLIAHCTQTKYTFTAEWISAGTLMWWDNRQSMHRASPYTEKMGARDLRRSTVIDDGPFAFGMPPKNCKSSN
ncbi:Alpha-ketoglutarate-dependent 2,4-dichlorophenoxyacetate dioxygenase [Lachnellula hyalina]|uniref:Alpha-ketoglutarate-dependent 2,4-dichlorophenoxyacetate dioxygenase n=1 Tax=Lachnellula hyalina TaxID=1316788 RepID=A0A8H8QU02_9HELO|nr:Alpha-ketoglutarate-dependent 2,4-dichlorophenoxyacetate dioxygenase [Lachnellula hyalina]TVY22772.1 Alpha-ketoglutarate-dependent 2,4-dichlorophenoxyacetate dioxygenase [Lachnellula hyalina]